MTLVILAAGLGSRYGGLKQLDPMTDAGNFIIDYSAYDAVRAGFDRIVFIIKEENLEAFKETIGNRVAKKAKVEYVFQKPDDLPAGYTYPAGRTKPLGTAHALYCTRNVVKDNFAIINADDFYGAETFVQLAKHLRSIPTDSTEYCMVGYHIENTLTDNGTVTRGVCEVNEKGLLTVINERTKIRKEEGGAGFTEDDGATWTHLPNGTVVSMNCWGLTPRFFDALEGDLKEFLDTLPEDKKMKGEFYLPMEVGTQMGRDECTVKVYDTAEKWMGVTYPEDKASVHNALVEKEKKGEYPVKLWD